MTHIPDTSTETISAFWTGIFIGTFFGASLAVVFMISDSDVHYNDVTYAKTQFVQEMIQNGFTIKDPNGLTVKEVSFGNRNWTHTTEKN